ncbi:MAG: hypothetical protein ACK4F9_04345 [Brevinematia bacterium]
MIVEIEKNQGEYVASFKYDIWASRIILHLANNEDLKTFVLEDCISSNKEFLELKKLNHKKLNNTIILDGKEIQLVANDNILKGKIFLVPISYSNLSEKKSLDISSLPTDFSIEFNENNVKVIYRNPEYSSKIIAFLLLREIGIIPSEFHVDSLAITISNIIPRNDRYIKVEMVKFGKFILPHKITLSILIKSYDGQTYQMLSFSKNKWKTQSINSQKGAINFIHKILLNTYEYVTYQSSKIIDNYSWIKSFLIKISKTLEKISKTNLLKWFITIMLFSIGIYIMTKLGIFLIIILIYFIYFFTKRLLIYINFKGKIV